MNPKYTPLFQSLTLNNGIKLKNRLVVAPLTLWASNPDGTTSGDELAFIDGRASDFGLFIYSATLVSKNGKTFIGQPSAYKTDDLAGLTQVAHAIKSQGAKAILQLHHGGASAVPELVDEVVSASRFKDGVRALRDDEICQIIQDFASATKLAMQAGFDGVEIHGANGFLLQQFVSRHSNQRTDKWGEPFAFIGAVIDSVADTVKNANRPDFIVGYRLSPEEEHENGLTMRESLDLIDFLVNKPLQYLHISLWDFYGKARRGADTAQTRMSLIYQKLNHRLPMIGVGNLLTADDVLNAYQTGWAEMIAVGKAVMINPNFAHLIATGRENEIQTELKFSQKSDCRIPERLWEKCVSGASWLPKVKD